MMLAIMVGCDGTDTGESWLQPDRPKGEQWTIRCVRSGGPESEAICRRLAEALRQADGLKANKVRVQTDATSSTVCYGQYEKVPAGRGGVLAFPPEMLRDLDRIRGVVVDYRRPFFLAVPELLEPAQTSGHPEWQLSKAAGTYTLQVAMFYNTPTFNQRKEVAEEYVQQLRADGYEAYYTHELVRSIVFVGDFEAEDLVRGPDGRLGYGPKVEQLIRKRPEEFQYLTENGFVRKYQGTDGHMRPVPSQLVPVPRGLGAGGQSY